MNEKNFYPSKDDYHALEDDIVGRSDFPWPTFIPVYQEPIHPAYPSPWWEVPRSPYYGDQWTITTSEITLNDVNTTNNVFVLEDGSSCQIETN